MTRKFLETKVRNIMQKRRLPLIEQDVLVKDFLPFPMNRHHVWVTEVKGSKKVIGVLTEHDILHLLCPHKSIYSFGLPSMRSIYKEKIGDVMVRDVISCSSKDDVRDILREMHKHGIRRLPVIDREEIVGEVCLDHIIEKFSETIKRKKK